jgi:putative phage-type endonuclease
MMQETLSADCIIDRILAKTKSESTYVTDYIMNIVNNAFSLAIIDRDYIVGRIEKIKRYKAQLAKLLQEPQVEQRTEKWYAMRKKMVTASDFAQALGSGKFGTQKQFYQKKCGYEEEKFNPNIPPLKWGVMFEPIACGIYEMRMSTKIHEFGLVPHPSCEFFGASPDGISDLGIMLEIKCPYKRKITGEIPLQYYYQIQGQLDVCGLDECDYLECEFEEYDCKDDFIEDIDVCKFERGIIIEYLDSPTNITPCYKYSDIVYQDRQKIDEIMKWAEETSSDSKLYNVKIRYWKLRVYNVVRVYRNNEFVNEKLGELAHVWEQVKSYQDDKELYLREVGAGKTKSAAAPAITGYAFLED